MKHNWTCVAVDKGWKESFIDEMGDQLFEKGNNLGIKQFEKYDFILLIGLEDFDLTVDNGLVKVTVEFVLPNSYALPVRINWSSKSNRKNPEELCFQDVDTSDIVFDWCEGFPIDEVLENIRPYRKSKKGKNNFEFDVEFYYNNFPDIELKLFPTILLDSNKTKEINDFFREFQSEWNSRKKGKEIEHIGLTSIKDEYYSIVIDFGINNNIRIINELLKQMNERLDVDLKLVQVS